MLRVLAVFSVCLVLSLQQARAQSGYVSTDLPSSIEGCVESGLSQLYNIRQSDRKALFDFFLSNIDVEAFGRYNYKRAWVDWGQNTEIKRLAVYDFFQLMTSRRSEISSETSSFDARLADRPMVKGNNVHHIIARIGFEDGSSTTIVLFTVGCRAFGFMYGGTNLRSLVDANLIERQYRAGKRAPF